MRVKISEFKGPIPGHIHIISMPLEQNVPAPKDPRWKLVRCTGCGSGCWERPEQLQIQEQHPEIKALCTLCAAAVNSI